MILLVLFLFLFAGHAYGGNVLVFIPLFGHSHVKLMGNLAELLANDGHNVTILSYVIDPRISPLNTEHPNIHNILFQQSYSLANIDDFDIKSDSLWTSTDAEGLTLTNSDRRRIINSCLLIYRNFLEDKDFFQTLIDTQFDLAVTEIYEWGVVGFFEALNVKSYMFASAVGMVPYHFEISGIPFFPSFVPYWVTTFGENMSFWERFVNLRSTLDFYYHDQKDLVAFNNLFREFYPNMEDISEIAKKKTGIILSNSNEFTESPRMRSNMIQYIGGTNVHPVKPVNEEISNLLDLRPKNVYFSFGTFCDICDMPLALKKEILSAFAEFPEVTFLWKHEDCKGDETPIRDYPNVVRRAWWPQNDLLGDRRLNAFISHGGMNSITEAAFRGTPMITIPLIGDQYLNAKTTVNRGTSIMIKRTELGKETLVSAMKQILDENSPITRNAKIAASVLEGKDDEYRKSVVRWANLLIEFGPMEHLVLPSKNLNFFQLYSLDILGFLVLTVVSVVFVIVYTVKIVLRFKHKLKKE